MGRIVAQLPWHVGWSQIGEAAIRTGGVGREARCRISTSNPRQRAANIMRKAFANAPRETSRDYARTRFARLTLSSLVLLSCFLLAFLLAPFRVGWRSCRRCRYATGRNPDIDG